MTWQTRHDFRQDTTSTETLLRQLGLAVFVMVACLTAVFAIAFASPLGTSDSRIELRVLSLDGPVSIVAGDVAVVTVIVAREGVMGREGVMRNEGAAGHHDAAAHHDTVQDESSGDDGGHDMTNLHVPILVVTAAGVVDAKVAIQGDTGTVVLDAVLTQQAGLLTVKTGLGTDSLRLDIVVHPGEPVDPLVGVVGQRTLVVGGDRSMIVSTPFDHFGNAVAEGHKITAHIHYPEGSQHTEQTSNVLHTTTRNLVGYFWFASTDLAGAGSLSLTMEATDIGRTDLDPTNLDPTNLDPTNLDLTNLDLTNSEPDIVNGQRLEFLQVAGPPEMFSVQATVSSTAPSARSVQGMNSSALLADGRTLLKLRTSLLTDEYGNTVTNGTSVRFVVAAPDGWRQLVTTVLDGHAETHMTAPTMPGTVTFTAEVGGTTSKVEKLTFLSAVSDLPIMVTRASHSHPDLEADSIPETNTASEKGAVSERGAVSETDADKTMLIEVRVGPVLMDSGGYVPDGTQAWLSSNTNNGSTEASAKASTVSMIVLRDGIGVFVLTTRELADLGLDVDDIAVTVLGTTRRAS